MMIENKTTSNSRSITLMSAIVILFTVAISLAILYVLATSNSMLAQFVAVILMVVAFVFFIFASLNIMGKEEQS